MRGKRILVSSLFVWSIFYSHVPATADIVYDSLGITADSSIMIDDFGNTVTLAGSKRYVSSVTIMAGVGSSHIGEMNDYILRFYLPTAPNDYPGKLFWQSPPLTNILMTGGVQEITFEVPYIRVPDTFIFSFMQAGDAYFPLCSGTTIGSSPAYCWTNLTYYAYSTNQLQARIEAHDHPNATLLATINDSGWCGSGAEDYYCMRFKMKMGGYWDMFGPSFFGVTEQDKGSYLQLDAADLPEAVDYLTNGTDENLDVLAEFNVTGDLESNTLVKSAGIASGWPDLCGCVITEFGFKINNIIIDHSTPGWTYFTWDVTWEIWGFEKTADINKDSLVNLIDFSLLAAAWDSHQGDEHWNTLCDIATPGDNHINVLDLQEIFANWLPRPATPDLAEDFETGDFSSYTWQHLGNANWNIVSDVVYEGTYAAHSGTITHYQQSTLQVEIDVTGSQITFYKKVSSEPNYDYLRFYIDGVEQNKWSGSIGWSQESFPVSPGLHTFKWSYTKDGSISSGSDCAWIDNILIE